MSGPLISVLIPARDEERFLPGCLASIDRAADAIDGDVEVVVALNRCTDDTEAIADAWGAVKVRDDSLNLARIRNCAARAASGRFLVTLDADSRMSSNFLIEVQRRLEAAGVVGGGVLVFPDRWTPGVVATVLTGHLAMATKGVGGGAFWCRREDFERLDGFDEAFISAEDLDFAVRLRALGRRRGQRFQTICRARIVTSMRKYEVFGDWFFFRNPRIAKELLAGKSPELANAFWYEIER